jgi:hypothetical protein
MPVLRSALHDVRAGRGARPDGREARRLKRQDREKMVAGIGRSSTSSRADGWRGGRRIEVGYDEGPLVTSRQVGGSLQHLSSSTRSPHAVRERLQGLQGSRISARLGGLPEYEACERPAQMPRYNMVVRSGRTTISSIRNP